MAVDSEKFASEAELPLLTYNERPSCTEDQEVGLLRSEGKGGIPLSIYSWNLSLGSPLHHKEELASQGKVVM